MVTVNFENYFPDMTTQSGYSPLLTDLDRQPTQLHFCSFQLVTDKRSSKLPLNVSLP